MIDINKKYRYRDGEPARVLCVDRPGDHQSVISMNQYGEIIYHYGDGCISGAFESLDDHDLIEEKETITRWINVFDRGDFITSHDSKESADAFSKMRDTNNLFAQVKIEVTEGEGL